MSITKEEAIAQIEKLKSYCEYMEDSDENGAYVFDLDVQALDFVLSALHSITKEQIEKVWKGEWIGMTDDDGCTWYECSRCEHDLYSWEDPNHFCPACGAPMTDEAVDMMMERLEGMEVE